MNTLSEKKHTDKNRNERRRQDPFEKGKLSLERKKARKSARKTTHTAWMNERNRIVKFFHLKKFKYRTYSTIKLKKRKKVKCCTTLPFCSCARGRPPKSTFKGGNFGINGRREVEHCKEKAEVVVLVLKKTMDKTGIQQQKRTELYKFKRNSLIPD